MIEKVADLARASDFVRVYDSANRLFPEEMRSPATEETFLPQLRQEENYVFRDDQGEIVGFLSFRGGGGAWELTSLYVELEHQRAGIGGRLLVHFEERIPRGGIVFVKALKDASWAASFYRKHGYQPVDDRMREKAKELGIEEKPWSQVFWKVCAHPVRLFSELAGYPFRLLDEEDAPLVYELSLGNPLYFRHCPPAPTYESIRRDMRALPPGKGYADKHYGGLFAGERLIAVLDLITGYPNDETLFIGFFMVRREEQGRGLGTEIVSALCREFRARGFTRIRLGYAKGNPQSEAFWLKNGLQRTGIEAQEDGYTVVVLERTL